MIWMRSDLKAEWVAFRSAKNKCIELAGRADRDREEESLADVQEEFDRSLEQDRRAALNFRVAVERFIF